MEKVESNWRQKLWLVVRAVACLPPEPQPLANSPIGLTTSTTPDMTPSTSTRGYLRGPTNAQGERSPLGPGPQRLPRGPQDSPWPRVSAFVGQADGPSTLNLKKRPSSLRCGNPPSTFCFLITISSLNPHPLDHHAVGRSRSLKDNRWKIIVEAHSRWPG